MPNAVPVALATAIQGLGFVMVLRLRIQGLMLRGRRLEGFSHILVGSKDRGMRLAQGPKGPRTQIIGF